MEKRVGESRMGEYLYRVDAEDRIVFVNQQFVDFAVSNWKPDFDPAEVLHTSLLSHLHGNELTYLYRIILQRTRNGGARGGLPFRCDAPGVRRYMELHLHGDHDGGLELRSVLLREEPRKTVAMLGCGDGRSSCFLRVCSWCKKIDAADSGEAPRWLEIEDAVAELNLFKGPLPRITHSLCGHCYTEVMRGLE
jgi:hypothetical protein